MLNFYSVTLVENIETIKKCLNNLGKFYGDDFTYTIICPKESCQIFIDQFQKINVNVLDEETIISFSKFKNLTLNLSKKIAQKENIKIMINENRLGWYYQQVLKLSYLFEKSKNKPITMIDADTFLIRKISFFNENKSNLFSTHNEKHKPYLQTMNTIFNLNIPYESWVSTTCQLNSLTPQENKAIIKKLEEFTPKNCDLSISEWVTKVIINGVLKTHNKIDGSFFSEQDFIGFFLRYNMRTVPKRIIFLRNKITKKLKPNQELIASAIGFYHITYETWLFKDKDISMPWEKFFKILFLEKFISLKISLKEFCKSKKFILSSYY